MTPQLSDTPATRDWTFLVGLVIAGAVVKAGVTRVAQSTLATAPKRPTLVGAMIAGALAKDAVRRIGGSTVGAPGGSTG